MIAALHELHDLLDSIERDDIDFDQGAMDAAIEIVDRLILQHEPPLPTPKTGLCYAVPTPFSPASAPPPPPKPRPENQRPTMSRREKNA